MRSRFSLSCKLIYLLVREYDVSIVSEDRTREIKYADCQKVQPNNPESCAFVQIGERNCTGLTFCRQYPKGKKVSPFSASFYFLEYNSLICKLPLLCWKPFCAKICRS